MTPEQIAENVKRLREHQSLRELRGAYWAGDIGASHFHSWKENAASLYPQAIQTINALVQLVGEMQSHAKECADSLGAEIENTYGIYKNRNGSEYRYYREMRPVLDLQETLTKAAPIAELAKEVA